MPVVRAKLLTATLRSLQTSFSFIFVANSKHNQRVFNSCQNTTRSVEESKEKIVQRSSTLFSRVNSTSTFFGSVEGMATPSPSWLQETALNFEAIARHHGQPVVVSLPAINDNGIPESVSPERYDFTFETKQDDNTLTQLYSWQHLASESGLFHQKNALPSSLLWRVVNGGTLTIHCVDSTRPKHVPRNRPLAAIHFHFPSKIRPNCIGISETSTGTNLYVLTEDCALYNISLSEDVLSGEIKNPTTLAEKVHTHRPLFMQARFGQGKLSLDRPHFMYVFPSAEGIVFGMQDGTLHLYNPYGMNPYCFAYIDFSAARFTGDATLRKTIKTWIPTWSGHNPSYPAHIVISSIASTKHSVLFTISADQRLRIWSLEKTQFLKEYDLTSSPATAGRLLLQPPQKLLSLDDTHDHDEYLFYLLTYNPLEEGQFVLWGGEHNSGAFTGLTCLQDPFKPVTPAGAHWRISDFFLAIVKTVSDPQGPLMQTTYDRTLRLWVSWKSYYTSYLQYTDIRDPTKWVTIMSDSSENHEEEIENSVEFWLDRITKPGRFSDAVLLTALNIYQSRILAPDQQRDLSSFSRVPRKDLLSEIIGRKDKLNVNQHSGQLDFEKYRQDLSLDFSQFEKTCVQLANVGDEIRGLSFDPITGEVFVVKADGISMIRNLSGAEILSWGATGSDGQFEDVIQGEMIKGTLYGDFKDQNVRCQVVALARAAYKFRCAVAGSTLGDITAGLLEEVMSDSTFSVEDRLWAFFDKYLSDDTFAQSGLKEEVKAALAVVSELSAAFKVLLEILSTDICQDDTVVPLQLLSSVWGEVVTAGITGTVSARWTLLRDLAILSAWMYSTEDEIVEGNLRKAFEEYWSQCLQSFKGVNMLRHLADAEIGPLLSRQSPEEQISDMHLDDTVDIIQLPSRTTGLRYLVEASLDSSGVGLNYISLPAPMSLSLVIASVLTQINFYEGYSGMAIRIVSHFICLGANIEASRFARYLPNTPVGGYVWGHVLLQNGQWDKASSWFNRVAPILAKSGRADDLEYAKVVLRGRESDGIGRGLRSYYQHIAKLFNGKHAHSQTIHFCQKALATASEVLAF